MSARAFRIDVKRYPWRRVLFVQVHWLARRRATALPKIDKEPRAREAAKRRKRCRVCEPKST